MDQLLFPFKLLWHREFCISCGTLWKTVDEEYHTNRGHLSAQHWSDSQNATHIIKTDSNRWGVFAQETYQEPDDQKKCSLHCDSAHLVKRGTTNYCCSQLLFVPQLSDPEFLSNPAHRGHLLFAKYWYCRIPSKSVELSLLPQLNVNLTYRVTILSLLEFVQGHHGPRRGIPRFRTFNPLNVAFWWSWLWEDED